MKKLFITFSIFSVFILLSCSRPTPSKQANVSEDVITIGTFNIAWLGDGIDDTQARTSDEYKLIAEIIQKSDFEVIGLQEIENEAALNRVLDYLPGYKCKVSQSAGKQNVAVLYRDYIKLDYVEDYMPIAVLPNRTRPAMFLSLKKGNFDCYMMVVHFKSTSRYDDTPEKRDLSIKLRTEQAGVMSNWVDSVLAKGKEQDIIIVGDCNDFPERKGGSSLAPMISNPNISFLTGNLTSCKNEKWYVIDHIIVSNSAKRRFKENSLLMENFRNRYPKESADKISDHCPVGASFDIVSPDND